MPTVRANPSAVTERVLQLGLLNKSLPTLRQSMVSHLSSTNTSVIKTLMPRKAATMRPTRRMVWPKKIPKHEPRQNLMTIVCGTESAVLSVAVPNGSCPGAAAGALTGGRDETGTGEGASETAAAVLSHPNTHLTHEQRHTYTTGWINGMDLAAHLQFVCTAWPPGIRRLLLLPLRPPLRPC